MFAFHNMLHFWIFDARVSIESGIAYCGDCIMPNAHCEHCCELNFDDLYTPCVGCTNVLG